MDTEAVRDLLQKFQEGYTRRDTSLLDDFMHLFTDNDDLEVIGTNAVERGQGEWCLGKAAVRELVRHDWEDWGDVVYDVDHADISVHGGVAWLSTTGTVTDTIPLQDRYERYLAYVAKVLNEQTTSAQAKTLDIVGLGTDIVLGIPLSETFTWPLRFTAVAVRQDGQWRFQQMQFSFATVGAPDVRIEGAS